MGASKLLHRILKFYNYANLFKINEKCYFSISQRILILFVLSDSLGLGGGRLRNFYTELWNSLIMQIYANLFKINENATSPLYAVKVQRSLAPLSWFPGSCKSTAHVHQCCRFQSYAKSRRLHAITNEIYKRNLHCVNHIPKIHDNGPPRTTLWRLTLTAYSEITTDLHFRRGRILRIA